MQKCSQCGFHTTSEEVIRDPDTGLIIATRTVCDNCGYILSEVNDTSTS